MEIRVEARKSRAREDRAHCDRRATRTDDSGEAVRMCLVCRPKGGHRVILYLMYKSYFVTASKHAG